MLDIGLGSSLGDWDAVCIGTRVPEHNLVGAVKVFLETLEVGN